MAQSPDVVETAYGHVAADRLAHVRATYDLQALARCIAEYDQMAAYVSAELGPRDALARLYCMATTLLLGGNTIVPPHEGDLRTLVGELRCDLDEAIEFFQAVVALVSPLEQLPA
jgi:hypothetical protein